MGPVGDRQPWKLDFDVATDTPGVLARDADRADTLITVRATARAAPPAPLAEVLVMDRSLSMADGKIDAAKRALCTALDTLRDGTLLAVVAGHHEAEVIHPLTPLTPESRRRAQDRVLRQLPEGGTAIGQWLACAGRVLADAPATAVRHAVLYTDGKDEHESAEEFEAALTGCAGHFVCDVRGLGHDWHYQEVRRIAEVLQGDARGVVEATELTGDLHQLMNQAQQFAEPRVYLGLQVSSRFRLDFVRQTRPADTELTGHQRREDGTIHIPLGPWRAEQRQYQVCLRYPPGSLTPEEDYRALRVTVHAEEPDGTRTARTPARSVIVHRSGASELPLPSPENITALDNRRELGMAMRACVDAWIGGEQARADQELRQALRLAELLDDFHLTGLRAIAETGPDGRPRVRRDVTRGAMAALALETGRTVARSSDLDSPVVDAGSRRPCPNCPELVDRADRFCQHCGTRLAGGVP